MKKFPCLAIFIISFSLINSCDSVTSSNKQDLLPIDDGMRIVVKEAYQPTSEYNKAVKPHINLLMQTKDIFSCLGYQIVNNKHRKKTDLEIKIFGVKKPTGLCPAALGPATAGYKLNLNPGKYGFDFSYQTTESIQLTVTDSSLTVTAQKTNFIDPQTKTFWRYPEKSFAYMCNSYSIGAKKKCEELERTLKGSFNLKAFTFPDYGIKPYPKVGKQYSHVTYYFYQNETVFEEIGTVLNAYADSTNITDSETVYLSVKNWKNRGFDSWSNIDNKDGG